MAMPEFSASLRPGADRAELEVPALPVRRSGSTTDTGRAVPAASRPGHVAADYADPNLALLASLGEPAAETGPRRAAGNGRRSAPTELPAALQGGPVSPVDAWAAVPAAPGTPAGGWPSVPAGPPTPAGGWATVPAGPPSPAGGWATVPAGPPSPAGGWATVPAGPAAPGQSDWSPRGQEYQAYAATAGNPVGYHSAPPGISAQSRISAQPGTYEHPSHATQHQTGGYATDTPGYGIPASPGYAARNSYDTGPNTPSGLPAVSYGTAYGAGADQTVSPFGAPAEPTGSPGGTYTGSHAVDSFGTSYDTGSYGTTPQSTGSHDTTPYGTGPYPNSYGAAAGGQAARDIGWGPLDGANGRHAEGSWQHTGQAGIGGPASVAPMNGYTPPLPNGYAAVTPTTSPGTPAGGLPHVQGGNSTSGYASQPPAPAGGFASGYLSSSALSARHGRPEPERLTGPGSANPYGSYVTDTPNPPDDSADTNPPRRRARHRDTSSYDDQGRYGSYGDYGGGSRR